MKAWAIQRKPHRGGKWEYGRGSAISVYRSEGEAHFRADEAMAKAPHFKFRVVAMDITIRKEG